MQIPRGDKVFPCQPAILIFVRYQNKGNSKNQILENSLSVIERAQTCVSNLENGLALSCKVFNIHICMTQQFIPRDVTKGKSGRSITGDIQKCS